MVKKDAGTFRIRETHEERIHHFVKRMLLVLLVLAVLVLPTSSCAPADSGSENPGTLYTAETVPHTSETRPTPESAADSNEGPVTSGKDAADSVEERGTEAVTSGEEGPVPTAEVTTPTEIRKVFSVTDSPEVFSVGEDIYDLDCTAFLFQETVATSFSRFLLDMQERGFVLYATNGDNGIGGLCRQATLYNALFTVNITRYAKTKETYITVEARRDLSPLQIKPETAYEGTNTVFHNPKHPTVNEKYKFGELDIFQLTNKHFVVVDGAQEYSSRMFVEYLENIAGEGNVPVIDAWFFTHAHPDHIYCCWGVGRDADLVGRIRVNGFYYTFPNDKGVRTEKDYEGLVEQIANLNSVLGNFRTAEGTVTPKYKIHGGMVFYINEIRAEVLMTQDQLMPEEYKSFNDSSTSFRFTVYSAENVQTTFLIMGDANTPVCDKIMEKYDYNTLHTNFFTSLHHGSNDCPTFFQFIAPDYLIYTAPSKKTSTGYQWLNVNCKAYFTAPSVIPIPYS